MSSTSKDAVTLRAKRSKKPSDGKMRRNVEIFVLSAPAILLFVCFVILPIVLGAYYGFYQWKGYGIPSKTGKFVGFQNYITALKDPAFQAAILHTFEVVIGSLQLFDLVYIVWGKYVSTTAGVSTMATYMVREGRGAGNYGYGSAVALIIFVISLIIALVYQKFVLNRDLDGAVTEQKEAEKRARKRAKEVQHREVAALASEVK